MRTNLLLISIAACVIAAPVANADVTVPPIFTDHAVLQRGVPLIIWGKADPNERVSVSLSNQTQRTTADAGGHWRVTLDPLPASHEQQMLTIEGVQNTVTVRDILIGEVWLCSGQSNMELPLRATQRAKGFAAEADYPEIRAFKLPHIAREQPQENAPGQWVVCAPDTAPNFSAVAFHFGRILQQHLDVPIGLVDSSWGGSSVEAWIPLENLQELPAAEPFLASDPPNRAAQHRPAQLYNGMIHPLRSFRFAGALWYQGESNSNGGRGQEYYTLFPAMIHAWRDRLSHKNLPFYFVQLPLFSNNNPNNTWDYPVVRDAQLRTLRTVPNTGMAITLELGEENDIHPRNKHDVGDRLARWALSDVYGEEGIVKCGPVFNAATRSVKHTGVEISFDMFGSELAVQNDQGDLLQQSDGDDADRVEVNGFELAGPDGVFHPAKATMLRPVNDVIVYCEQVSDPRAVRYAWKNNTTGCNLFNTAGLPASPFHASLGE